MSSGIREWLGAVEADLAELYGAAFEAEAITPASVALLSDADLRDLGVSKMGHRRLLLDAIHRSQQQPSSSLSSSSSSPPAPMPLLRSSQAFSHAQFPPVVVAPSAAAPLPLPPPSQHAQAAVYIEDVRLEHKIGEGSFGVVWRAQWHGNVVAAKRAKEAAGCAPGELLAEAATCMRVRHPNCVTFYGVYRAPDTGLLFLVSEYCARGALDTLLQQQDASTLLLPVHALLGFCRDAAAGMLYLASLGIVHRDLAARNILLRERAEDEGAPPGLSLCAKVGDFGLSRVLERDGDYYQSESGIMPTRWCSPEALRDQRFNESSDCWSFGVLCWEIFSQGQRPYDALSPKELLPFLSSGGRLQRPAACPEELYALMLETWREDPSERPDFRRILRRVSEMLERAVQQQQQQQALQSLPRQQRLSQPLMAPPREPQVELVTYSPPSASLSSSASAAAFTGSRTSPQPQNPQQQQQQTQHPGRVLSKSAPILKLDTVQPNSLQQLYERAFRQRTPDSRLEFAIALFQYGDLAAAYLELTDCIEQAQLAPPAETRKWVPVHFARGYFNTRLGDFAEATSDFVQAHSQLERTDERSTRIPRVKTNPPPDAELPVPDIVTRSDMINAAGHATFLLASTAEKLSDAQRVRYLDDAVSFFQRALAPSASVSDPCGIIAFNLAQALYFRSTFCSSSGSPSEEEQKLQQTLKWYETVLGNSAFPIPADANVMKAKTLARLGRREQAQAALDLALEIDPSQRLIDLGSPQELRAQPAPPQELLNAAHTKRGHLFVQHHFSRPTWCAFCGHFIGGLMGKQGYRCSLCGYACHTSCFQRVRSRFCFVAQAQASSPTTAPSPSSSSSASSSSSVYQRDALRFSEDHEIAAPASHIHRFRECNFHKPKWCRCCCEFITLPYGKKGLQCVDCKLAIHKECATKLRVAIVLLPDDAPPQHTS